MWRSLHDAWWRLATQRQPQSFSDALACQVLQLGSAAYRGVVALRNAAYERGWAPQVRLPCPVVSIGALTVGGAGKTTCVELIAKKLLARGARVAVLSRGYGGARRDYWLRREAGRLLLNGDVTSTCDRLADEPQMLAARLEGVPIVVGSRRDRTGQLACTQLQAQVLILDDGFQHRRVQRDVEIVLVDARMPFDGWPLLPRGPMREPLSALRRADLIMVTKADETLGTLGALRERLRALSPSAALVTTSHEPVTLIDGLTGQGQDPGMLAGRRLGLVSSIGDPEGFESVVQRLHATVSWHQAFPDHHRYRLMDWQTLCERTRATRPDALVTTEKDWVRLKSVASARPPEAPLWVLGVRLRVLSGEDTLDDRLARL
jgi:tetraacyldisaccharide 4'-kinase